MSLQYMARAFDIFQTQLISLEFTLCIQLTLQRNASQNDNQILAKSKSKASQLHYFC